MQRLWRSIITYGLAGILLLTFFSGCSVPGKADGNEPRIFPSQVSITEIPGEALDLTETLSSPAVTPSSTQFLPTAYFTPSVTAQEPTQTVPPHPERVFCSPLAGHTLSDFREILTNPFDPPPAGKDTGHHGVDFAYYRRGDRLSILGVPVQSVMAGRVVIASQNRIPYGNMVIIETAHSELPAGLISLLKIPAGQSLYLLYAHLNETPRVELNEQVVCGQTLGEVGNTPKGWSSDPHLHLEGRSGPPGATFRGMVFYDTGATVEEMDNYRLWRMSGEFALFDPMILLEFGLAENGFLEE